jgi:hypothetical protein
MSNLLAIDPGSQRSGWCEIADNTPVKWGWDTNEDVRSLVNVTDRGGYVAVEYMRPRGMPTGQDEMDTMYELGRMTAGIPADYVAKIARKDVKMFLLGRASGTDANIRQALIDLFGGNRHAIGAIKCVTCKGKGWNGTGRPPCKDCHHMVADGREPEHGCGYEIHPGVLHGVTGHAWSALACGMTYLASKSKEMAL